jgi:predicted RNA-binding protein
MMEMKAATVYLDDTDLMNDALIVETVPEAVCLVAFSKPPRMVQAFIRRINLVKNYVVLESIWRVEEK